MKKLEYRMKINEKQLQIIKRKIETSENKGMFSISKKYFRLL